MAAFTTLAAIGSLALGAASYAKGQSAAKKQEAAMEAQAVEARNARAEQKADNAAAAATERRSQVREERVRRARIMQASFNSGAAGSSGEYGSLSSLGTQLQANIGSNMGRLASADRQSQYAQNAADFGLVGQRAQFSQQNANGLFSLSTNIFSAAGGFDTIGKSNLYKSITQ